MRKLALLLTCLTLTAALVAAPTAGARHAGPCYHEYVDTVLDDPNELPETIDGCNQGLVWFLCRIQVYCLP